MYGHETVVVFPAMSNAVSDTAKLPTWLVEIGASTVADSGPDTDARANTQKTRRPVPRISSVGDVHQKLLGSRNAHVE